MGKVMEHLGIADAMAKKVILNPALDGGVQLVAAGQAEIGIYSASEVAGVKGLTIVGPLPAEINLEIVYGGIKRLAPSVSCTSRADLSLIR